MRLTEKEGDYMLYANYSLNWTDREDLNMAKRSFITNLIYPSRERLLEVEKLVSMLNFLNKKDKTD